MLKIYNHVQLHTITQLWKQSMSQPMQTTTYCKCFNNSCYHYQCSDIAISDPTSRTMKKQLQAMEWWFNQSWDAQSERWCSGCKDDWCACAVGRAFEWKIIPCQVIESYICDYEQNPWYLISKEIFLQSESPSGMCAELRTVATSNNRDHMPWSLYYCLFAPHICGVVLRAHSICGEMHIQRNANWEFATTSPPFYNEPHRSHIILVKVSHSMSFTSWSQRHFVAVRKPKRHVRKASHCVSKQQ